MNPPDPQPPPAAEVAPPPGRTGEPAPPGRPCDVTPPGRTTAPLSRRTAAEVAPPPGRTTAPLSRRTAAEVAPPPGRTGEAAPPGRATGPLSRDGRPASGGRTRKVTGPRGRAGEASAFRVSVRDPDYRRSLGRAYARPHRGVRIAVGAEAGIGLAIRAGLLLAPAGSAASGATAASVYGLPLPTHCPGLDDPRPEVTTPAEPGGPTMDHPGVRCRLRRLPAEHVTEWCGLRVTTPARTFLDLAAELDLPDLVALGDVVLRRGLATMDDLRAMVAWAGRRRGVATARAALPLLDARSRSPQESRLRVVLALAQLPPPEVNTVVLDAFGGFLAEGDLVWREARVLVEYDGGLHLAESQRRKDAVRRNQLAQEGWLVLVYTADVLEGNQARIAHEVGQALRARGWIPSTPR